MSAVHWRRVPGYRLYEMSDEGDILSLVEGRVLLRPYRSKKGFIVSLRKEDRTMQTTLPRLLLLTFKPLPRGEDPRLWIAKPRNGDIYDIWLENWQWVRKMKNRLTEADVRAIRTWIFSDPTVTYAVIAKAYEVSLGAIAHIAVGETWAWVR